MMSSVFISYCRSTSAKYATALHTALGDKVSSFLDTDTINKGADITSAIQDALEAAKVAVLFIDEAYFTRRYCICEFDAIIESTTTVLIIAFDPTGVRPEILDHLPPSLRGYNWPAADEIETITEMVQHAVASETLAGFRDLELVSELGQRRQVLGEPLLPKPIMAALKQPWVGTIRPSIGDAFVGRANELWQIHHLLVTQHGWSEQSAGSVLWIVGGPGTGKTRLAAEYVSRYATYFPDGVFWIDANADSDALELQFHRFLLILDSTIPDFEQLRASKENMRGKLTRMLQQRSGSRILYVVDGLPTGKDGTPPLPLEQYCPVIGLVNVLVTSQVKIPVRRHDVHHLLLSELNADAAVALLTSNLPENLRNSHNWVAVAKWIGFLPLALELLNVALTAGTLTTTELLDRITNSEAAEELDVQMHALNGFVPVGSLRGIQDTFELWFEQLSPEAKQVAIIVAHLAEAPVPLAFFEALPDNVSIPTVRAELWMKSAVARSSGTINMLGVMHSLVASYLRAITSTHEWVLQLAVDALSSVMISSAGSTNYTMERIACAPHGEKVLERILTTYEPFLSNIAKVDVTPLASLVLYYSEDNQDPDEVMAVVDSAVKMGIRSAILLSDCGFPRSALKMRKRILWVEELWKGSETPDVILAKDHVAQSLSVIGHVSEAITYQQETLQAAREVIGTDHRSTIIIMDGLALNLAKVGQFDEALNLSEEAVSLSKRVLGEANEDTLVCMNSLAIILTQMGDRAGARSLLQKAVLLLSSQDTTDEAGILSVKASLAHVINDVSEAALLWKEVYEGFVELYSGNHPMALRAQLSLGAALYESGQVSEAIDLTEQAYSTLTAEHGRDYPATLEASNNLAEMLREKGKPKKAIQILERSLAESNVDKLSLTVTMQNNLALAQRDLGMCEDSIVSFTHAANLADQVLGFCHPRTYFAWEQLAAALYEQTDNHPLLVPALCRMLAILEVIGEKSDSSIVNKKKHIAEIAYKSGKSKGIHILEFWNKEAREFLNHGDCVTAYKLIEQCLSVGRRLFKASPSMVNWINTSIHINGVCSYDAPLALYQELVERLAILYGNHSAEVLRAMTSWGVALYRVNDHIAAIYVLTKATQGLTDLYGEEHLDTVIAQDCLGNALREAGDLTSAVMLQRRAVIAARSVDENNRHTLVCMVNLAQTLELMSEYSEAQQLNRRAAEQALESIGEEDEETVRILNVLGERSKKIKDYENALFSYENLAQIRISASGLDSDQALHAVNELVFIMLNIGKREEALDWLDKIKKVWVRNRVSHWVIANMMALLAKLRFEDGHSEDALLLQRQAVSIAKEAAGSQTAITAMCAHGLVNMFISLGRQGEASFTAQQELFWLHSANPDSLDSHLLFIKEAIRSFEKE